MTYLPRRDRLSDVDRVSGRILDDGMALPPADAVFVATYDVTPSALAARGHTVDGRRRAGRVLRSVLMKPESEEVLPRLHAQLEQLGRAAG